MIIGIGNIGSTSLKSKIIDIDHRNCIRVLGEANIDRIKTCGKSTFACRTGEGFREKREIEICGYEAGFRYCLDWYVHQGILRTYQDIEAMGFKCVMGKTNGANILTEDILEEMREYCFLAPVHNPPYLEAICELQKVLPVPMVGLFEPSFFNTIPEFRRHSGLPWRWSELGIKKLGYHGASHRYLAARAEQLIGCGKKVVTVHLGGSSSLSAIESGKAVDNTYGFSTCSSGILQGTRIGDVDCGALLYGLKKFGLSIDEAMEELSNKAGLKGMAGIGTEDFRAVYESALKGNERAAMAVDLYVEGIRRTVGAYAAILGGIDGIVFGGGIGENSPEVRRRVLEKLEFMGIEVDCAKNDGVIGAFAEISSDKSRVKVFVVPTNEEIVVAYFTKRVLEEGRDLMPEEMKFCL
jgi:acetate kinase